MRLQLIVLFAFILATKISSAQDTAYARSIVNTLASDQYNGRGYVLNGCNRAGEFIAGEFEKLQLKKGNGESYFQPFTFPVNTFPGKMSVAINKRTLTPGADYIVSASCPSIKGTFSIVTIDSSNFKNLPSVANKFVLLDTLSSNGAMDKNFIKNFINDKNGARGFIFIEEKKLTWTVADVQSAPIIHILRNSIPSKPTKISLNIKAELINYKANNIIGIIPGTLFPDSFLVITAHYDHLGMMGKKTIFPGANDNASGTAMMLNIAKYFTNINHSLPYSVAFIAFAGEEAGLLGSYYYTESPTIPLSNIKFLLNVDLMGTGDEGITVVNGSVYENDFKIIDSLNTKLHLLPKIGKRGKAHNSDHYYFTEKNVPSFFCYTLGGRTAYHDIYDISSTLPLTKFSEVFTLLKSFIEIKAIPTNIPRSIK
jgi:hypothetical protein